MLPPCARVVSLSRPLARTFLAALLGASLIALKPPPPRAIATEPRIHHRGDVERSGSYNFPPIRTLPRVKWTKDQGRLFMGTPLATKGKLYSGGSDGTLYVLDARDGTPIWAAPGFEAMENAVVIAGDLVIAGGQNGKVRALDRRGGKAVWFFDAGAPVYTAPLIVGDIVYIATYGGVDALDLYSGQAKWKATIGSAATFVSFPAFHGGAVFVSVGTTLYSFDAITGERRWRVESPKQFWSLALGDDKVYVGNADGNLIAYAQSDGKEVWRFKSAYPTQDEIWSAPAVDAGVVYIGSRDQSMYAVDATTGAKRWEFKTTGESVGDPVVSAGVVYFSDSNHALPMGPRRLYAVAAVTGQELWHYETRSSLLTTPTLGTGVIYETITGQVMALTAR